VFEQYCLGTLYRCCRYHVGLACWDLRALVDNCVAVSRSSLVYVKFLLAYLLFEAFFVGMWVILVGFCRNTNYFCLILLYHPTFLEPLPLKPSRCRHIGAEFLQFRCPSCHITDNNKALKAVIFTNNIIVISNNKY